MAQKITSSPTMITVMLVIVLLSFIIILWFLNTFRVDVDIKDKMQKAKEIIHSLNKAGILSGRIENEESVNMKKRQDCTEDLDSYEACVTISSCDGKKNDTIMNFKFDHEKRQIILEYEEKKFGKVNVWKKHSTLHSSCLGQVSSIKTKVSIIEDNVARITITSSGNMQILFDGLSNLRVPVKTCIAFGQIVANVGR